jgi:serine/threonine-protein kinase
MVHPAAIGRHPGRKLDRYELIAEIASGGMGTVYLARLEGVGGFQRLFAIKLMHPHLAKDPQFVAMLLDEARLAARIHHPNAVSIIDVCESDVGHYLVMEYIEGFTLDDVFEHPELSQEEKMRLGLRILYDGAVGLHAAHELSDDAGQTLNLVHRDVSPQNILVGVDGVGRITDFGVARAAARITTSRPGLIKGKPCYMAPEQALGRELDRRADVFALGIILWEILCGEMLFYSDAGDAAMLGRVLQETIVSPREKNERVSEALESVVMKALDRDPTGRFQTARELAEALLAAATAADLIVTNHELGDRLKELFADDVKARRASIQKHLAELGTDRESVASDVFEQIPRLEQRPSYLAPAPDPSAWHEATAGGEKSRDSIATADTKAALPSARLPAPQSIARRPSWPALAGLALVLFGLAAWLIASRSETSAPVGEEIVVPALTDRTTATESDPPTVTETGTETDPETQTERNTDTDMETVTETAAASVTPPPPPAPTPIARPTMRAHPMTTTPPPGVVVESNPYLQ